MIYLASIQGFTDFVYRKAYADVFTGVDAFFIPYIALKMDNAGNVLNKMKQFWIYFSYSFPNRQKVFKRKRKSSDITQFNFEVKQIFLEIS